MNVAHAIEILNSLPRPHILEHRARVLYDHIRRVRPESLLELGTAHGGSAVIMAAALEENGSGHLISVDSSRWYWTNPAPSEVLARAGLSAWVTLDRSWSTYNWFLKTTLEGLGYGTSAFKPQFDFVFLDGAKNWTIDGLAVVVIEKLMRPGGWLLLDDLTWSYEKHAHDAARHYDVDLAALSAAERREPHLSAVFDLLVRQNQNFEEFVVHDKWWAWARKGRQ